MEDYGDNAFLAHPPAHPMPQLQGPFEESMVESVNDVTDQETHMDSVARRTMLLEMPKYERVIAGRWKQKPGERYHPLWKITAQISFGMHLLAEGLAKSEEEVMKILQSHVDEIDGFLERTTEDFELAQSDIQERLRYLKLPLDHVDVFDRMLEDRAFRMSIVEGNEKIEHIVERTSEAMKDAMKDIQKGLDATKALKVYLNDLDKTWTRTTAEHEAVYLAMVGNVEGWSQAFMDLHLQGNKLGKSLVQLSEIVAEMQKRAGIVSRRTITRPWSNTADPRGGQRQSSSRPHSSKVNQQQEQTRKSSRPGSKSQIEPSKPLPIASDQRFPPRVQSIVPRHIPSTEMHAIMLGDGAGGGVGKETTATQPSTPGSFINARLTSRSPAVQTPAISELAANEAYTPSLAPKPLQPRAKNFVPTELPAEIPQEILAQVPHSNKSPFSGTLAMKRQTSNSRPSNHISSSKLVQSADKTMNVQSTTRSDYFGPAAVLHHEIKADQHSKTDPLGSSSEGLGIRGIVGLTPPENSARGNLPHPLLAFTSHPPDLPLAENLQATRGTAAGPGGLPTPPASTTPNQTSGAMHQSQKSSLGEPGPEIESQESDEPAGTNLLAAIAKRSLQNSGRRGSASKESDHGLLKTNRVTETTSEAAGIPFYAEMEGSSPVTLAPRTFAPVELEATPQRPAFSPRNRTLTGESKQPNGDVLSATISSQDDFFKLHQASSPDKTAVDGPQSTPRPPAGHVSMPAPIRGETSMMNRDDRSSMPSKFPSTARPELPLLVKTRSGLLDRISHTPPDSPIHTRSLSEVSTNSARLLADRPSRSLGPPQECPPPPAPGGRQMVSPDYATAGAFDGERRSKHGSRGSSSSWKKFFGAGSPSPLSPGGSRPGSSAMGATSEATTRSSGVEMMDSGGKDILWFKGMGKDGMWVK